MIPFSPPKIYQEIIDEVTDTLKSGWITTGPKTKLLEKKIEEYIDVPKVLCVNSATAGLELMLRWYGVKEGDEVIIDIPADLAYGEKGVKGKDGKYIIPPNTPLRFDVLVVKRMSKEEADKMQQKLLEKQKAKAATSSDKK